MYFSLRFLVLKRLINQFLNIWFKIMYIETKIRSVVKALSWRLFGSLATALLVYILTQRVEFAVIVGGTETVIKILLFFLHERLWEKIHFGKKLRQPFVLWFTGLSGSGKNALSSEVYHHLIELGYRVEHLDGDVIRKIFPTTGFSKDERNAHIKRVGYLASRLEHNGVIVIVSLISPYEESRSFVKGLCKNFVEVYVSASIEVCEQRDVKGLYRKAREGIIKNFTGIDAPYEVPENPKLIVDTEKLSLEKSVNVVLRYLEKTYNV